MGLMLITHDLAVVSGMAHCVALMYAGQIIEVASAEEFFRAPKHPYARLLLRALPDTTKRGGTLAAIPGTVPALSQEFHACRFAPRCDRVFADCHVIAPPLLSLGGRHVRCLLYRDGRDPTGPIAQELPRDAEAARGTAVGDTLLEVRELSVRFHQMLCGILHLPSRRRTRFHNENRSFTTRCKDTRVRCVCNGRRVNDDVIEIFGQCLQKLFEPIRDDKFTRIRRNGSARNHEKIRNLSFMYYFLDRGHTG